LRTRAAGWSALGALALLLALADPLPASGSEEPDYRNLCREIETSGFTITSSGVAYGVPYAEIKVPVGFSINALCRRLPSFRNDFLGCRNKIAFFNALNPSYVKTRVDEPYSIEADTLKIPLDLNRVPEIFPPYDPALAGYEKYLLVDIGKGFLALYAEGQLKRVFPVSAGAAVKRTPLLTFQIQKKIQNHWSTIYDTWMPWSLLLKSPYYIHAGVLPGRDDSAGCIRMFPHDAKELFHLVEVGTPGRIIETPKLERIYPAPFCR
jgi:hypothetical protein